MKHFFLCVCASFLLCSLYTEEYVLVPREVFVGDRAQLTFLVDSLNLPKGTVIELPVTEIATSVDVSLESVIVRATPEGASVSVFFTPWKTGLVRFPSFTVEKVTVIPPEVRISSLIDKTGRNSLESPRPPLLVPGTTWLMYGYIAGFVLALVAVSFIGARFFAWFSANPRDRKSVRYARLRTRMLERSLKSLEKRVRTLSDDAWYSALSISLRSYCGSLCSMDSLAFVSSTRSEVVSVVRSCGILDTENAAVDLDALLAHIDVIRFSGIAATPDYSRRLTDISVVRSLVSRFEKEACA